MKYPPLKSCSKHSGYSNKPVGECIEYVEEFFDRALFYIKHACCLPLGASDGKKKKRIKFDLANDRRRQIVSRISLKEEEMFSPLTFDCLEVPESPVVDPYLGCRGKVSIREKLRNLFFRRRRSESNSARPRNLDKCCGRGISMKKTVRVEACDATESRTKKILKWLTQRRDSENESDLEERHCGEGRSPSSNTLKSSMSGVEDMVTEVPYIGGDGPQNNEHTHVKRRSNFFNEIYESNEFSILD